jgi:hypothetical protein
VGADRHDRPRARSPSTSTTCQSSAFLEEIEIHVFAVTSGNAATVAFKEDGPWSLIDVLNFLDTGNSDIITQITGWDLMIINKLGATSSPTTPCRPRSTRPRPAAGGTGGSFAFLLRVPVELVPRDALGPLPNKSASTPFKLKITVAPSTSIWSSAPTTLPAVTFRMTPVSYWEPTAQDGSGNPVAPQPPAMNTAQFWNKTPYSNISAGPWVQQLDNAVGYPIRNLIFVLRDSTNSRSQGESDFPDPFKLQMQSNIIANRRKPNWKDRIAKDYGYVARPTPSATEEQRRVRAVVQQRLLQKPGWENRRQYLRTTDGMRLEAKGTIGGSGAHRMDVFVNYVSPAAGVSLAQITT